MGMAPWGNLKYEGSKGGRRSGAADALALSQPDADFVWPAVAFLADDCSIYVPLARRAWGVELPNRRLDAGVHDVRSAVPVEDRPQTVRARPAGTGGQAARAGRCRLGVIGSPSVSYDGRSIYVPWRRRAPAFSTSTGFPVDGGPPQQLTSGPFHDIDPAELPDGRIVFTSTRIGTFEEYHAAPSRALFVMQPDGSGIKSITHTPIFDNEPKVLADGRIAFIRSDNFFGRAKVETQIHAFRPDGTAGQTEFGADVGAVYGTRLRLLGYGSPAPLPDGRMAVISNRGNFVAATWAPSLLPPTSRRVGRLGPLPDGRLLATVLGHQPATGVPACWPSRSG
jgi:hypothetical protein